MSYLLMPQSSMGSKAIISFWVKSTARGVGESIPTDWMPGHIENQLASNQASFPGSSYYSAYPQFKQPHIWCYPFPGPEDRGPTSWKDSLAPFLSFGDTKIPFKRVNWKLKAIGPPIWLAGHGGVPQQLMAQVPEAGDVEIGYVPPSCIGSYQGQLRVILQTKGHARYKGCAWAQTHSQTIHIKTPIIHQDLLHEDPGLPKVYYWKDFSLDPTATGGIFPNQFVGFNFRYTDVSTLECAQHPEAFIMDSGVFVSDGRWHHVLLSFDLNGTVTAESTGPNGDPPLSGTWGQYSGINGEYALAPFGYITNDPGYPTNVSYASKAAYGAPFEEVGKYGPANGGTLESTCRGWLAIDDNSLKGQSLNHAEAWSQCQFGLDGLDPHAILPPNAFLIPGAEIRSQMTTNMTNWERDYRTLLGGFDGPAAKIDVTNEPRQQDYIRPSYSFHGSGIAGGPLAIPGGELWGENERNYGVILAELQIWHGQSLDTDDMKNRRLFISATGEPVEPKVAEEKLGKPAIRLHWASNWISGGNIGSSGQRQTGPGSGTDGQTVKKTQGQFQKIGHIDRYEPDPAL